MNRVLLLSMSAVLGLLLLNSCQRAEGPPPRAADTPLSDKLPSQEWQQKWDQTLAEARKEGVVNVYVSAIWGSGLRSSLTGAFKAKYGINLEFSPLSGTAFVARVKAEQNAGLFLADAFGAGSPTFVTSLIPNNLLGPMESLIMLPEVLDPAAWDRRELFIFNKDEKLWVEMLRNVSRTIMYNTNLVKKDEIASYKDLLKPQFKGQVTMLDPTDGGAGTSLLTHLTNVYEWDEAMAFFRDLVMKQEVVIFRDARLQVETVARGKYSVILGGSGQYKSEFLALGAPVAVKIPKERDHGSTSFGAISVPTRLAHPNAARIFVNWLLTSEGQTLFARGAGAPSRRLDVSTEGIDPIFIPAPGEEIRWQTPEVSLRGLKVVEAARVILSEAAR